LPRFTDLFTGQPTHSRVTVQCIPHIGTIRATVSVFGISSHGFLCWSWGVVPPLLLHPATSKEGSNEYILQLTKQRHLPLNLVSSCPGLTLVKISWSLSHACCRAVQACSSSLRPSIFNAVYRPRISWIKISHSGN